MLSLDTYFDSNLQHTSYTAPISHLQDMLSLTHLYLKIYDEFAKSPDATHEFTRLLSEAWQYIISRETASTNTYLPLIVLKDTFNLSFFEYLCITLALSTELDENLCLTYTTLCGNAHPSFHLAMCLYGLTEPIEDEIFASADLTTSSLQYLLHYEENTTTLMRQSLCLHKNVMLYLTGNLTITDDYSTHFLASTPLNLAPLHKEVTQKLVQHLTYIFESSTKQAIGLEGLKGLGKQTVLKQVCAMHHVNCLFLDLSKLQATDLPPIYIKNLCFKLLMSNSLLCLTHCEIKEAPAIYEKMLNILSSICKVVFLCFDAPTPKPFEVTNYHYLHIPLGLPTLHEKIMMWTFMKEQYNLTIDPKLYASKYNLVIGKLETILKNSECLAAYEAIISTIGDSAIVDSAEIHPKIQEHHIIQSILNANQIQGNATLIQHPYTFDDLILDAPTLKTLHQICNYVTYRYTVFEEWGYGQNYAYGRGLNILFYGAPGTGKTMCASVLANAWGLALLKVDLSRVVDKYIGETEKRLDEIFMCAAQNNYVLFFDEADSLFAKRTEISSSNDKYANIEVSYLLQKMELYNGIVIMATNLVQNFDEAFKRRINFMVRFNLPNADTRKALWQKAFPATAPISANIDFDLLGEKYDLSPSVIKSIVLYAAFLASSENRAVTMEDLLESIKYEYEKNNRMMPY